MTTNEDFLNELNRGTNSEISCKNCYRLVLMGKSKTGKVIFLFYYITMIERKFII